MLTLATMQLRLCLAEFATRNVFPTENPATFQQALALLLTSTLPSALYPLARARTRSCALCTVNLINSLQETARENSESTGCVPRTMLDPRMLGNAPVSFWRDLRVSNFSQPDEINRRILLYRTCEFFARRDVRPYDRSLYSSLAIRRSRRTV